jgi:hypothetical protein
MDRIDCGLADFNADFGADRSGEGFQNILAKTLGRLVLD